MEGVIIVAPLDFEAVLLERLAAAGFDAYIGSQQMVLPLTLELGDARVFIYQQGLAEVGFEPEELAKIADVVPEGAAWALDFRSPEFVKDVLLAVADDPSVMVDNDCGTLARGDEFARLIRERPEWDWRFDG